MRLYPDVDNSQFRQNAWCDKTRMMELPNDEKV